MTVRIGMIAPRGMRKAHIENTPNVIARIAVTALTPGLAVHSTANNTTNGSGGGQSLELWVDWERRALMHQPAIESWSSVRAS